MSDDLELMICYRNNLFYIGFTDYTCFNSFYANIWLKAKENEFRETMEKQFNAICKFNDESFISVFIVPYFTTKENAENALEWIMAQRLMQRLCGK